LPLALAAVIVTALTFTGAAPADLGSVVVFGTTVGTYLIGFAALGLLVLGYRAYRDQSVRRLVGILWDLGTFWPRAAHPLAPPCYAERCVPDLAVRVGHLVERDGGVVLSAHSQGTVIAAALVWQLPAHLVNRLRLVTHGSPLARLYGQAYTAWFGPDQLAELQRRLGDGRWVNL